MKELPLFRKREEKPRKKLFEKKGLEKRKGNASIEQLKFILKSPEATTIMKQFYSSPEIARSILEKRRMTEEGKREIQTIVNGVKSELKERLGSFHIKPGRGDIPASPDYEVLSRLFAPSDLERIKELSSKDIKEWTRDDLIDATRLHATITVFLSDKIQRLKDYEPEELTGRIKRLLKKSPNLLASPEHWTKDDLRDAKDLYHLVDLLEKKKGKIRTRKLP